MSFSYDGAGYMRVIDAAISAAVVGPNSPITIGAWVKRTAALTSARSWISVSDANDVPSMYVYNDTSGGLPRSVAKNGSSVSSPIAPGGATLGASVWGLFIARLRNPGASGLLRTYLGASGGTEASYTQNWPSGTAACDRILLGAHMNNAGVAANILLSGDKIAHAFVLDGAATDATDSGGDGTSDIERLAAGRNPLAVFTSGLVAYWPGTADKVDLVNSLTLTDVGGTITIDTGDNPTVDDPPGGGGGGGILLTQVERGRAMGRGILRGV